MKDIFLDKIIHYSLVVAAVVLSLVSASQAETSFPASSCEVIPVAATTWKSDFTDLVASNGQADLSDLPPNFNGLIEVQVSGSTVIMMAVTIQDSRIINLLSGEDITSSFQHGGWVILNDGLFSTDIDIDQALIDTINNEIGVEGFEELVDLAGVDNALVFIQDDWSGIMSDREALSWVLDTLGRDNLVSFMHGDPSDFLQLLSAVNTLGRDDFVRLIGIVGQETLLSAASAGNLRWALRDIQEEIGGMDQFQTGYVELQSLVGEEGARAAFSLSPLDTVGIIDYGGAFGWDNLREINSQFPEGGFVEALTSEPGNMSSALYLLDMVGMDRYRQTVQYLQGTFGDDVCTELFSHDFYALVALVFNINGSASGLSYSNYYTTTYTLEQFQFFVSTMQRAVGEDALLRIFASSPSQFIERLTGLSALTSSDSWDNLVAKFGQDRIVDLFAQDSGLTYLSSRIPPDSLEEVIANRLSNAPDGRLLAVIVYPKYDDNYTPGFEEATFITELIQQGYRVMYYEADTDAEAIGYIEEATSQELAAAIIIGGHGNSTSIKLGGGFSNFTLENVWDLSLDYGDGPAFLLRDNLSPGGTVILASCSTGAGACSTRRNMGNFMHSVFLQSAHLFAPVVSTTDYLDLGFDSDGRIISVGNPDYFDFSSCTLPHVSNPPSRRR